MNQGLAQVVVSNVHVSNATASEISSRSRQLLEGLKQLKWDITDTAPDMQTDMPEASSSAQPSQVFSLTQESLGPASRITILYFLFYFGGGCYYLSVDLLFH